MLDDFINGITPELFVAILFVGFLAIQIGAYLAQRRLAAPKPGADTSALNTAIAAILGVIALVLSFSFSFALARYEQRRELVVQEANDIGTMYLRTSVLAAPAAKALRSELRDYIQARIDYYGKDANDEAAQNRDEATTLRLQDGMWRTVSGAVRADPRSLGASLLMQTTNDVIDVAAEQYAAFNYRLNGPAVYLILLVAVLGAVTIGIGFGLTDTRHWVVSIIFALLMTFLVDVILDLDSPRSGRILANLTPLYMEQQNMAPHE